MPHFTCGAGSSSISVCATLIKCLRLGHLQRRNCVFLQFWNVGSLDQGILGFGLQEGFALLCRRQFVAVSSNGGGGICCPHLEEECTGKDGSFLSYVCQVGPLLELHHSPCTSLFISSFFFFFFFFETGFLLSIINIRRCPRRVYCI